MKKEKNIETDEEIKSGILIKKPQETKNTPVTEQEKQSLMDLLTDKANAFAIESRKKQREREAEKVKFLLKGKEISLKEIREVVIANARPYAPMFPNENSFYKEIYRLMKWEDLDHTKYTKPRSVAKLTLKIIYGRFPKDVLQSIQVLNNYLPNCWIRGYKNFQFLNDDGQKQVLKFRDESIKVMETCETMHDFRIKFSKEPYNIPYTYTKGLFNEDEITPLT